MCGRTRRRAGRRGAAKCFNFRQRCSQSVGPRQYPTVFAEMIRPSTAAVCTQASTTVASVVKVQHLKERRGAPTRTRSHSTRRRSPCWPRSSSLAARAARPLLTHELYDDFVRAGNAAAADRRAGEAALCECINRLPRDNRVTLELLLFHLARVAREQAVNKMSPQNLAICFAPSLLSPPPHVDAIASMAHVAGTSCAVTTLIQIQMAKTDAVVEDLACQDAIDYRWPRRDSGQRHAHGDDGAEENACLLPAGTRPLRVSGHRARCMALTALSARACATFDVHLPQPAILAWKCARSTELPRARRQLP